MKPLNNLEAFNSNLSKNTAVLVYFSHDKCSVCKTLKPKLSEYLTAQFPKLDQVYVNIEQCPELAAQYSVFTVPVVIVFFDGLETYRKARSFGIQELGDLIQRPYQLLFD